MKELSMTIGCPNCLHMVKVSPPNENNTVISQERVEGSIPVTVKCLDCGHNFEIYWIRKTT